MDDGTSPMLEVGFAIDAAGSFDTLRQLQSAMDTTEARVVAEAAKIEKATAGMINVGGATAQITSFGNAATREAQTIVRSNAQIEKAGERIVRQLERENTAFGKSRSELRQLKAEEAALAAERAGNTDLARRIREQETELWGKEAFAARQAAIARTNAAEDAAQAESRAIATVNAQLIERNRLEAAIGRTMGSDRPRATDAGAGFSALAARAADEEAVAKSKAAAATERLSREHAELAAAVRGSHAAQMADAAAAERLRASTDPLYAATKRLNDEIAESTRLYLNGATAPAEYARQQQVLTGRLREVETQHDAVNRGLGSVGATGKLASYHMLNLAYNFQDLGVQMFAAAGSSDPLKMAMMAIMQQGSQISGVMMQAGVGIRAVGAAFLTMSKSILLAAATNPYILAGAAAIGVFAGAVKLLQSSANDDGSMKKYAASLGLTAKEIRNLDNVTVTFGDTAKAVFQVAGRAIWDVIGPAVKATWEVMKDWLGWIGGGVKSAVNFMIGGFVGAYNVITKTWDQFPAAIGDAFYSAVNAAIDAVNTLIRKSVDGLNGFIRSANSVLGQFGLDLPEMTAPQIDKVANQHAGALRRVGEVAQKELSKALKTDYLGALASGVGGAIADQARKNAMERLKKQATEKGYLDDEKGKSDKTAERLAREDRAIEAQIRNLYALAEAYKVSGAAALIAEARVKAESDAIKKRGDIEMFVDRQVRVAIAQRVTDAAKSAAATRDQAVAQALVNAQVAAGIVPAERAADLVRDQMADLPLLAAIQAAQMRGLTVEADRATQALEDQRATRAALQRAEATARFNAATASGAERLAELREELRLVGATDEARARALATLRATQEAQRLGFSPEEAAAHVRQQGDLAAETERVGAAQRAYNDALTFTADRWDLIARNVDNAARGMAEAFGDAGRAIGDLASIFAGYQADRTRLDADYAERVRKAGSDQAQLERERTRYALATATSQVGAFGDMAAAARGFFKEGSSGYAALTKAIQVFRTIEFALSVRAMAQDAIETASALAKSGVRAAKYAVEAVAKAIASLPFPLNLAAGAATAAALAALGIAIGGAIGGGGKNDLEPSNNGTGTVFGDPKAQSQSIKRAIDQLKEVDTIMLSYSREMAASLRSIDSQIGGFAAVILRSGDVNASEGVAQGFKPNAIGSILGAIPLVGGLLKSLFGTTTSVIGSGLFGGPQSIASIIGGGFDASTYSDIERKSKFLGITTSKKYSTQYGAADPALENQFTLILRSFYDAISAAAGPLGVATSDIQQRLNSFVVNIGKIDLKGLSGEQISEKLSAIFGAAADQMAAAAFPGFERFQRAGEGMFETLVRVASTVETVTASLDQLGLGTRALSIDAKLGLADQFESLSALASATDNYFKAYYTREEQAAASAAQFSKVFQSLGLSMPSSLSAFRALVEAQDLTTAAGQATYATLLQLAPAFADLQNALAGAKSAADVIAERQDLERRLLEQQGNTAALRALDLAKLDASNRALQQQIWAIQDAQEAARAAEELRKAWTSVGDSIMDEVRRIRGLTGAGGEGSFASLQGQFNAAAAAARGGDIEAAKSLPGLSQAMLAAAEKAATSRQELDRIRAQTAAALEAVFAKINGANPASGATPTEALLQNMADAVSVATAAANDDTVQEIRTGLTGLREEVAQMRTENNAGHAATAGNTGSIKRTLDNVTADSGGDAISTRAA